MKVRRITKEEGKRVNISRFPNFHIGLYGFRKLIVYVIKDNGDNTSIVSLNKDGSFPKHVWNCNLHNINE